MPIGKKFDRGYITLSDRPSTQFRKIAEVMTKRGDKMNHATARGIMIRGLEKLAAETLTGIKGSADPDDVRRLTVDEAFQSYVGDIVDGWDDPQ